MNNRYILYILTPVWQIWIKQLLFGAATAGDMFQRIIDEIFKELLIVFGIANDN